MEQNNHIEKPPNLNNRVNVKQNEEKGWKRLVKDIVRPPRSIYKEVDLGTPIFHFNGIRFTREDISVLHEAKTISLTLFQPQYKNDWIILYLHGNSSSKMEATGIFKFLPFKFSLASFDFLGCGLNQQADLISLGYREAEQVASVVKALQSRGFRVIVWGRSMGAATALKFGKAPIIIADSSFQSFRSLCKQVAKRHAPNYLPSCLIGCIFPCVFYKLRKDVKSAGDYDIQKLDIKEAVSKINEQTFLIFMSGDEDLLIDKQNSQNLYNSFNGKKKHLQIFKGSHNGKRPESTLKKIMKMISEFTQQQSTQKETLSRTKIEIEIDC